MENTMGKMKKFCKLCNRNLIDIKERYCNSCKAKIGIRHSIYKKDRKDTKEQKFYSSKEWLRVRDIIRGLDNNLCLMCLDRNELNNSGTIHHIEELKDNRKLRSHTDARSILFYFCMLNMEFLSIVYLKFIINIILL